MKPIQRGTSYMIRKKIGSVRIRVRWNNKDTALNLKLKVDREKWDGKRCVPNSFHFGKPAALINTALQEFEDRINLAFLKAEMEDRDLSVEELHDVVLGTDNKKQQKDFWITLSNFVIEGERDHQWSYNTIRSVRQVITLLEKFDPKLTFETLTSKKLEEFVRYQQTTKLSHKTFANREKGYSNTTILKNCRVVKWMLRWAADRGYIDREVEQRFRPSLKTIDRPVIFLRWAELMDLYNFDFSNDVEKAQARDFFCFCCFTSLRFSDAFALSKAQVKTNSIEVITQKTSKLLKIELNKYSRAILNRYRNNDSSYALPHIPNDRMNKMLKKIGKEAGINELVCISRQYSSSKVEKCVPKYELLTTHCGRRTFICNALALGISPNVVMKWTGHSEYSAMKPYIDIADEIKANSMALFDKL